MSLGMLPRIIQIALWKSTEQYREHPWAQQRSAQGGELVCWAMRGVLRKFLQGYVPHLDRKTLEQH